MFNILEQLFYISNPLINRFAILAISEHCLFEEQLGMLKTATDSSYDYLAVSSNDNPHILSGERGHGGVALIWNDAINNPVTYSRRYH